MYLFIVNCVGELVSGWMFILMQILIDIIELLISMVFLCIFNVYFILHCTVVEKPNQGPELRVY